MKIEWLNNKLTEARVTKGILWWKRVAWVVRASESIAYIEEWAFAQTGHLIKYKESLMIEDALRKEIANQALLVLIEMRSRQIIDRAGKEWVHPSEFPYARVMK